MPIIQHPVSTKFYLSNFYGMPIKRISRITDAVINDQDIMPAHRLCVCVRVCERSDAFGFHAVNLEPMQSYDCMGSKLITAWVPS